MVHVAFEDVEAYGHWAGKELPTEADAPQNGVAEPFEQPLPEAPTEFPDMDYVRTGGQERINLATQPHEVISAGFWPGSGAITEPAFYAYAAPEPAGFKDARVGPTAAFYSTDFNEFILKYDDVRRAVSPRDALLQFLQTTYDAGAALGNWNRAELERSVARASERSTR